MDVVAGDATKARDAGLRLAQRRAWQQLWARLTGQSESSAPGLGDSGMNAMVSSIEVETERFSSRRYIARLSVAFDPAPIRSYIGKLGLGPQGRQSHPILVLPVMKDGGAWTGVTPRSPWFRAWSSFADVRSAIDYVQVSGTPSDGVLLSAPRGTEQSAEMMRLALLRYGAEDYAVAEAVLDRTYPGGPVNGTFRVLHGLERRLLGEVKLTAQSPAGIPAMLAQAVSQLDDALNKALSAGKLKASEAISMNEADVAYEPEQTFSVQSFRGIDVLVETPNAQAWSALEAQLRRVPSVAGLTLTGLSLGGTSQMRLDYGSSVDWLHYDLDQIGLRLAPTGDGRLVLRARRAGDPPIQMPAIIEGVGEEGVVSTPQGRPAQAQAQQPQNQSSQTQPQGQQPQGQQPQGQQQQAPSSLLPPSFGQRPPQE